MAPLKIVTYASDVFTADVYSMHVSFIDISGIYHVYIYFLSPITETGKYVGFMSELHYRVSLVPIF